MQYKKWILISTFMTWVVTLQWWVTVEIKYWYRMLHLVMSGRTESLQVLSLWYWGQMRKKYLGKGLELKKNQRAWLKKIILPMYDFFLILDLWLLQKSKLSIDRLQWVARRFKWTEKCATLNPPVWRNFYSSLLIPHRMHDTWSFGFLWGYHFQFM